MTLGEEWNDGYLGLELAVEQLCDDGLVAGGVVVPGFLGNFLQVKKTQINLVFLLLSTGQHWPIRLYYCQGSQTLNNGGRQWQCVNYLQCSVLS